MRHKRTTKVRLMALLSMEQFNYRVRRELCAAGLALGEGKTAADGSLMFDPTEHPLCLSTVKQEDVISHTFFYWSKGG